MGLKGEGTATTVRKGSAPTDQGRLKVVSQWQTCRLSDLEPLHTPRAVFSAMPAV